MIRQYYAQRCRGGSNPLRIGTIPSGAIFYLQDELWWRDRFRGEPERREPWIVEAFLNGVVSASRRNPETGHWQDSFVARRSDTAIIRSLRTGERRHVPVRILLTHEDHSLSTEPRTPRRCHHRAGQPRTHRSKQSYLNSVHRSRLYEDHPAPIGANP